MSLSYFVDFVRCEDLDSNRFCFVLKMYFSLPQLFVFLFDILNVAVFVSRGRLNFVKKPTCDCVRKYYLLSLSLAPSLALSTRLLKCTICHETTVQLTAGVGTTDTVTDGGC